MKIYHLCKFKREWQFILLLLLCSQWAIAQNISVSGIIKDASTGESLVGASVIIKGTTVGVVADVNGNFSLQVPTGAILVIDYLGYEKQEIKPENNMVILLAPTAAMLDDVVVVGYGTARKKDLTGSVSSVTAKDFNPGLLSSPAELLNGKVAGVQILQGNGSPTSGPSIRIRGGASLNASNDPLIVVDGVPLETGGITGSGNFLSLINPNDIENMTILKDASSTAIYGSRASNGVVLITTKRARENERLKVIFSTNTSLQTKTRIPKMLDESQFRQAVRQRGTLDGTSYENALGDTWTDWNKEIFRPAAGTDNNVSVSGNIAKVLPFRVSLGYMYQDGILKSDNYQRYTGNLQLSPSFFQNHLKLTLNLKGAINQNRYANTQAIGFARIFNPTLPIYSGNNEVYGGYTQFLDNNGKPINSVQPYNPLAILDPTQEKHTGDIDRLIGNFDIDYKMHFLPELRAHLTLGFDGARGNRIDVVYPQAAPAFFTTDQKGYLSTQSQTNTNKLLSAYLNYNKEIESIKSTIDVTLGYDYQDWISTVKNVRTMTPDKVDTTYVGIGDYQRHVLLSFYGRVNYSYDGRYMITATLRTDGTSRFAPENRWGIFPSVAAAWNIKNESFLKDVKPLNDLKLRVGWGVTGQQDGIGNYGYLGIYNVGDQQHAYQFGNNFYPGYVPASYDANLRWETTNAYNAGLDFAFLDYRLTGSLDYYYRSTTNLIATVTAPAGSNITNKITTNVGSLTSQGIELALNGIIIATKDWNWSLGVNATYQQQQITSLKLAQDPGLQAGPVVSSVGGSTLQILTEGYAPYMFYLKKQVYDQNGRPVEGMFADLNKDGQFTNADFYRTQKPMPDFIFGINTSVSWKKLTLSTVLRANVGNYVYNAQRASSLADVMYLPGILNNVSADFVNSGFVNQQILTDYYLENASFLKMENLSLSYDFGQLAKYFSLKVGALVQNVFVVTKYQGVDPEVSSGYDSDIYPRPRIYSLNLTFGF